MANKLYRFTAPDGTRIEFMAPEGLSDEAEQKLAYLEYQAKKTGKLPGRELGAKPEQPAEPPSGPPTQPAPTGVLDPYKEAAKEQISNLGPAIGTAGVGLLAGLAESRGKGPASIVEKGAAGFSGGFQRAPAAPPVVPPVTPPAAPSGPAILGPSGTPLAPTAEQQATRILQGTTGDLGTTGRARMQGFNIETAQAAARAKEAEQGIAALQQRGVVPSSAQQVLANAPGLTSTPSGVVFPRNAPPPTPKPMGALEEVTQLFRKMAEGTSKFASGIGGAARALPVISYPLAGYSLGQDYGSIQEELAKERPDYADIALRGVGALGTGLSLHPVTAPVGLPMATIAPLIAAGRRKMQRTPEATPQELEEASRPSFRMSRP